MAETNRKPHLTSTNVELLKSVYEDFKKINKINNITLAKLLNRTMDLYNKDKDFRDKINSHNELILLEYKF
jgi:hypothetical protein